MSKYKALVFDTAFDNSNISKGVQEIKGEFGGLRNAADATGKAIKSAFNTKSVESAKLKVNELESKIKDLAAALDSAFENGLTPTNSKEIAAIQNEYELHCERLKKAREKLSAEIQAAAQKEGTTQQKAIQSTERTASKAMRGVKKITGGFSKIVEEIKSRFSGASKTASGFGTRLKNIVSGAFVFNLISAALRKVTDYLGKAISSSKEMKGALANLKGAAANAAAPIISALTPALVALANAAATVFSYLAKIVSFFTGKSVSAASTAADQIKNTAGAAKKAMKSLAGFDEITKLDDKNSGGGSGGGNSDINYDFQGKSSFLDSILQSVKNGGWDRVGSLFGDKINSVVDSINGIGLGTKLGTFVNNIVSTLYGLFSTTDFSEIGHTVGDTITATFATIDWNKAGGTIGSAITALPGMVVGFIEGTDWTIVADSTSKGLSTAFISMKEWFLSVDWFNLGDTLYQGIVNIDWINIATSAFSFLGAALASGVSAIWGFIDDAIADVVSYFSTEIERCGGDIIGGLLLGIIDAIANIGQWLIDNVFTPFIDGFKEAFDINSPAGELVGPGEDIWSGVLKGILDAIAGIGRWIKDNVFTPFINSFKSAFGISDGSSSQMRTQGKSVIGGLLDGIRENWNSIPEFISGAFNNVKNTISDIWKNGILPAVKGPINSIIGCINGMISGIVSGINTVIRALNRLSFSIPDWVPGYGGKSFGFNLNTLAAPQIPYLAQGAVLPANKPFLAMVGDQRHGTNVEAPLTTIQDAVAAVMGDQVSAMMAGFEALLEENRLLRQVVENIELGDTTIGQSANRYLQKMAVMRGGSL